MSEENVEIVRGAFQAFAQQGPDALIDSWDSEIELWMHSGLIQAGGTYRGKASGVRIEGRFWYLFTLRKGKVVRWELYPEKVQALEAAGLEE